jgi:hypothetical protein
VLQVIYGCSPARDGAAVAGKRLFVGQQVDVFIEVGDGIKATGKGGEGSPTGKSGGGRAGR